MITASGKTKSKIPPIDDGVYLGTCRMLLDLGTQEKEYQGESRTVREVFVQWELHDETVEIKQEDGSTKQEARCLGAFYTLSLNEKSNLRKHLDSWRGKPFTPEELDSFDIEKLLSVPAQIQVITKEKAGGDKVNKIGNVMAVMKGMVVPELTLPVVKFSFEDGDTLGDSIPEGLQAIIKKAKEYNDIPEVSQDDLDRADAAMDAAADDLAAEEQLDEPPF